MSLQRFVIFMILTLLNAPIFAYGELCEWNGISNKNHIHRIVHDDNNIYVSSIAGGITIIDKESGNQSVLNRANNGCFDNSILDIVIQDDKIWMTGKYYGLGYISSAGLTKIDVMAAGCFSSQLMQGLFVDSENKVYVGGLNGFYIFDGNRCIYKRSLNDLSPMAIVTDIKKSNSGVIYVSCSDWSSGSISLFKFDGEELIPIQNPAYRINRMAVDGDTLWLATDGQGLIKYHNNSFTKFSSSNSNNPCDIISDIAIDDNGDIWFSGIDYIVRLSKGVFTKYSKSGYLKDDDLFTAIDVDGGDVYVGTLQAGLFQLRDNGFKKIELTDNTEFSNMTRGINSASACIDSTGCLYLVSQEGLNEYDPAKGEGHIRYIKDLFEVKISSFDGALWQRFANPDSCIVRVGDQPISFSNSEIKINLGEVSNIMQFDNEGFLWVATLDGISYYNGAYWQHFTSEDAGFDINNIKCIGFDSHNKLWCGTFGNGLIMYDKNCWFRYTKANSPLPSDYIGSLGIDNNDVIFMNCRHPRYPDWDIYGFGLTSYNGKEWKTFSSENSGLLNNNINCIAIDANNVKWLATCGDKGITAFDNNSWNYYNVDNSGLALNTADNIVVDRINNRIWFTHPLGNGVSYAKLNNNGSGDNHTIKEDQTIPIRGLSLSIYNMQGLCVFSTSCFDGEIPSLPPGLYILYCGDAKVRKIIIY